MRRAVAGAGTGTLDDLRHAAMAVRLRALCTTMDLVATKRRTATERDCSPTACRQAIPSPRWCLLETTGVDWYRLDDLRKTLTFGPLAEATSRRYPGSDWGAGTGRVPSMCSESGCIGAGLPALEQWHTAVIR
jgi:hypothetical protein